jgi:hypothetical protein
LDAGKTIAIAAHASQNCGAAVDAILALHGPEGGAWKDKRCLENAEDPGTHGPCPRYDDDDLGTRDMGEGSWEFKIE